MRKKLLFWMIVPALCGVIGCTDGSPVFPDAGIDSGSESDSGMTEDSGGETDSAVDPDGGGMDGGPVEDGGSVEDGGPVEDGGSVEDGGPVEDGGSAMDGGTVEDGGPAMDSGVEVDSGVETDGGVEVDSGVEVDAGPIPMACPEGTMGSMLGEAVISGTTRNASNSASPSCIGFSEAPDMGYTFTAPKTAPFTFSTRGSALDTVLYVLDGASCTGDELACNDDVGGGALTSELTVDLELGQTVTVMVDAWSFGSGDFVINAVEAEGICDDGDDDDMDGRIDCDDPDCDGTLACTEQMCADGGDEDGDGLVDCDDPDCDESGVCFPCAEGALTLDVPVIGSTATATDDFDARGLCGSSSGGGKDHVYTFTAPADGDYTFASCGASFDTLVWMARGTCSTAVPSECNDDSCGLQSSLTATLVAGETVLVGIDGYSSYPSGAYQLEATVAAP